MGLDNNGSRDIARLMKKPRTYASLRDFTARFTADTAGASAIEFGLVALPLIFLVMAIIEFGLMMFTQMAVEAAVGNVARTTTIGNSTGYPDRVSYIKAELRRQTEGLINGNNLIISSEVLNAPRSGYVEPELCLTNPPTLGPSCPTGVAFEDTNGNGVYDGGSVGNNYGTSNEMVEINVALPWKFFTPLIGSLFGSGKTVGESALEGTYIIRSSAVVKNEPF